MFECLWREIPAGIPLCEATEKGGAAVCSWLPIRSTVRSVLSNCIPTLTTSHLDSLNFIALFSPLPCVWIGQSVYVSAHWSSWMMMTGCSFLPWLKSRQRGSQEIQQYNVNSKVTKLSCKKVKAKTRLHLPACGESFAREGQHQPVFSYRNNACRMTRAECLRTCYL